MNETQMSKLDDLTLYLNFDLSILKSSLKDDENLEVCTLTHFVERIYQDSEKIRDIFNNTI